MKKLSIIMIVSAAVFMMGSCGNKTQQVPFDNGDSADIANADPTVYGICGESTTMNVLQLLTDMGDTLTFELSEAQENNMLLGGMQTGDRMVVVPNHDKTQALIVINETTLLGNWVMPNPLDGSDEVGIRIKEGGIAESIEQSSISYRTWKLLRGQLEIVHVEEDGSGLEETNIYDIIKLTADSLVYKNAEDLYEYSRQRPKAEYGKDVQLEDASMDDFSM